MADKPALHVIVLGPTGGPLEDRVTGLLVRSTSTQWAQNSIVAVDGGTLLAGVTRSLADCETEIKDDKTVVKRGPFMGLGLPHRTARANAAHFIRDILGIILITHPHLDHLSGFVLNSPMLEAGSGPKPLAALPSVLNAIKNHIFNDVVWPNMSDEDGGAGLITYQRLVGGGNPRFGRGETMGYVQACNGLLTKCLGISHGHYEHKEKENGGFVAEPVKVPHGNESGSNTFSQDQSYGIIALRPKEPGHSTTESTAFFLRDVETSREIIVFGDVEPDSVSLRPRNKQVWDAAAPRIVDGSLRAIFIECSYSDAVNDAFLYGHLCPRHLIAELEVLAGLVEKIQESRFKSNTKHKPGGNYSSGAPRLEHGESAINSTLATTGGGQYNTRPRLNASSRDAKIDRSSSLRLVGLSVYIIHIKDSVTDGPLPGDQILQELKAQAEIAGLGCNFHIPTAGEGIWV